MRTAIWRSNIARLASSVDGLIPVVKGNGYGFGRLQLAKMAADFCDTVAVGTVHELEGLPTDLTALVLTPTLTRPHSSAAILTVGHERHIEELQGWGGRVTVKLASSMQRFGRGPELVEQARQAGLEVVSLSIHPPLTGSVEDHRDEITALIKGPLAGVEEDLPIWVSHLDPTSYAALPQSRTYRLRIGTALWHGDKAALHLSADVLDVRPIVVGEAAGYRLTPAETTGHLVMVGAGTAHGAFELPNGASPFHFRRTRMALHEPPHMHSSMTIVPTGDPLPAIGDRVDLQRPLHTTMVDEYEWL